MMIPSKTHPIRRASTRRPKRLRTLLAGTSSFLLAVTLLPVGLFASTHAAAAVPVGQGFAITPSDLTYILAQIKIAEAHVANTTSATGPCGALIGTGANQLPSPLLSLGLRTVDGSCNNLQPGQETFGAADQVFPRLGSKSFRPAEGAPADFFGPGPAGPQTSYAQKKGLVFDTQPRVISNLIVDQTSTNPAAIAAAGFPVRTQGNPGVKPCTSDPVADDPSTPAIETAAGVPAGCVPSHETLFIPNVTTDVGLSPPYNSLFTIFGQFFDHGVDQTVKSGGTVFVPLKADDPLIPGPDHILGNADDLDESLRFMVLTRGQNQPGDDGILGDPDPAAPDTSADDVQDAANTDSPWVDQSQTYTSHPSHQAFLREYEMIGSSPISTGMLLSGKPRTATTDGGISTWKSVKDQAASKLGLLLTDADVTNIPMLAADPYGNLLLSPTTGMPQYVTASGLISGNLTTPVPVPADVKHFDTPFLTDIAHSAVPTPGGPDANTVAGKSLDTPVPAGTYDDELLDAHFACGDGRCNENIALSAVHQVFHSEHDRLAGVMQTTLNANPAILAAYQAVTPNTFTYGQRLFQAARFVTEMEYQHLVFEEFARKIQPGINPFEPFAFTQTEINPAVKAEFAHAVYRFGHSMLTETIARHNEDGAGGDGEFGTADDTLGSENDISLLDGFLNPPDYTDGGPAGQLTPEEAAGSIIMGMSDQVGNELDEFVTDTLRNNLLGLPLDLPTVNMTRARSEGIPALNVLRRDIWSSTNDGALKPYVSWVDFGENLKHPESLVNFVAAYGQHPTVLERPGPDGIWVNDPGTAGDESADNLPPTLVSRRDAARAIVNPQVGDVPPDDAAPFMNSVGAWGNNGTHSITGLDVVDLWVGGLAEMTSPFGGLLGTTFNYVFENQLTDLQNGDRLYYLARTPGMNLRTQLEGNSFAELMMRNTNVHSLKADAFSTADCKFQLKNLAGTPAGFTAGGNTVADDVTSECDETAVLIRMPDGTIKYRAINGVDPSGINAQAVYNGTNAVDRMYGGNDNDTFWGGLGSDVIEGGSGADVALGGEGNDIITDLAGDDVPKGGPGNDAIDAGPGLDIIMGGEGKDFTNGGANANETFGGDGDDFIMLGESLDAAFGDSGDDYQEGGNQPDLMQGDSGNLFFLDTAQQPGSDILIGQGGDDDYDMEGGDDIGLGGPGVEKVSGASGYDWEIGLGDPQPSDMDLAVPLIPLDILQVGVRDKFNEVESLSGGDLSDTLRGDDIVPSAAGGGGFIGCDVLDQAGLNRINGLDPLVPTLATPLASVVAASASQFCPILSGPVWGDGNVLLGGGGSDLIEGRGADDVIDGDRYVNIRLSVRTDPANPATQIGSASVNQVGQSAMTSRYLRDSSGALTGPTLQEAVFTGSVDPGNIVAVREILTGSGGTDTAVFSGPSSNYTIDTVPAVAATAGNAGTLASVRVTQTGANVTGQKVSDGIDTVRNIENLRFCNAIDPVTLACTAVDNVALATPAAPTIAAAGSATAGNASATLSFTGPSAPATGPAAITSFEILATPVGGGTTVARTGISRTATTGTVTGLTNGVAYTLQVRAVNGFGAGAYSVASNSVTPTAPVPLVTTRSPAVGAVNVAVGANVTATFDVAMNAATINGTTVKLTGPGAVLITSVVSYNATTRVVTLNPTGNLAQGTVYTATLTGGAGGITNAGGTPLVTTTWSFTTATAANPAPTVTAQTPLPNSVGVGRNANLTARFSEAVTGVSAATFTLRNTATNALVSAVVTNTTTARTQLNPAASLLRNTQYTVTLAGGPTAIRDLAGAPLVTVSWAFTTAP